jgi:hypothetical protein
MDKKRKATAAATNDSDEEDQTANVSGSEVETAPTSSKTVTKKAATSNTGGIKKSGDDGVFDLGGRKKVSVSSFKGSTYINIREYYVDKATQEEKVNLR